MNTLLRVLNLEDNVNDAALNREMLSARWPECEFVRVDNRKDFIAALERGNFDVILSDYTLPAFDGPEALALANEMRAEIPFLFVSGTIGEDAAIEALKHGATDYVLKHRLLRLIPAVDRALQDAADHVEYRRTEEAMRESEHKYRELFECLSDAAFLADELSDKIIDTNRSAETLLGCTRADILGDQQSQFLALANTRRTGGEAGAVAPGPTAFECELLRAGGEVSHVEVRTTKLTLHGHALVLRLCHITPEPVRA